MTGANPGNWPDQMGTDASITMGTGAIYTAAERVEAFKAGIVAGEAIASVALYTAAEMKAARLETVERCRIAVSVAWEEGPVTRAKCVEAVEKLKEEIENE